VPPAVRVDLRASSTIPFGGRFRLLAAFVAVSLLTRGPFLGVEILDLDEAAHAVGSWELLRGRLLYVDFADNKPPLLYLYYALAQWLLGRGMLAVRLVTVLVWVPLTALGCSAFFGHDRRGKVAGFAFLLAGAAFLAHDMHAVHAELLMLLPGAWALVLLRDAEAATRPPRAAAAGALIGAATLLKYQAGFWLPALGLALLLVPPRRLRSLAAAGALVLGFALPLAATYVYFRSRGGAEALWHWNITHNLGYASNPIPAWDALLRAIRYLLPFLVVTAPLWWGWRHAGVGSLDPHAARLVSLTLVLSIPAVFLGLRFYPHYFIQLYLPLALAAAPWLARNLEPPLGRAGRRLRAWAVLTLGGFTLANAVLYYARADVYEETDPGFARVAARLRGDACFEGASLFVWGFAPLLYYYAELPVASRFVMPQASLTGYVPGNPASRSDALATDSLIRREHWDWLMADLESSRPAFVLDTAPAGIHGWERYPLARFPRLLQFVRRDYEPLDSVDDVHVYRRRGCDVRRRD
jgi:4-amino-4-deoxy-L-arabinose transferase-like glycosyltransferase